jgi:NAD+ diphosphatase
MLQDLSFGKLQNEFRNIGPADQDVAICICEGSILLKRNADDSLELPRIAAARHWAEQESWRQWNSDAFRYVFRMQEENYFMWMGDAGGSDENYHYENVRQLRQLVSKEVCFAVLTAWHLYTWYRNNRFCGCCGATTAHESKERMLRCPDCGNMIFPRISPAVIVAVTDGDRLLLSKYAGRGYTRYALLAGYTEIGETIEQTVHREVMEEVGLRVRNLRYYKSQPWGVDGNVLMGFFCDLDGTDEIHIDPTELSFAQWYPRDELPAHDDGISLTREMIRVFEEGNEPR